MSDLRTHRLRLRAWLGSDEQPFIAMGHDPEVMEFFPALQTPEQSLAAIARWNEEPEQRGWSNWAVERSDTGTSIGFEEAGLQEIVSFTTLANLRSRAVMERIGMRNSGEDFEHPAVPQRNALRMHCLYRLSRTRWQAPNPAPHPAPNLQP